MNGFFMNDKERWKRVIEMREQTLKRRFINEVYDGDYGRYRRERKEDYCRVQFIWTCWMDALCKNGEITDRQWNNAVF